MSDRELLLIVLRVLVYLGSTAAAVGVFFAASFPRAAGTIGDVLRRQIVFGFSLLLVVEPIRYTAFQFAIAQGDWALAFGPGLRWMGLQTPIGQAAAARLTAAVAIAIFWRRSPAVGVMAAAGLTGSFLLEGHSASSETWTALGTAGLFLHLAAIHWWLGALYPLLVLTRRCDPAALVSLIEAFGRWAFRIVAGLVTGGALLLGLLTGWSPNIGSLYQQRFLLKLGLVALLLSIAAVNKLRLTPLLARDHGAGMGHGHRSRRLMDGR